ncbi:MAG: HlyD family secretion protein [Ignavibacteriota bacterium]
MAKHTNHPSVSEEVHALLKEQQRLRREVQRLSQQQRELLEKTQNGNGSHQNGGGQKEGQGEDKAGTKEQESEGKEQKDGGKEQKGEEKEQKEPPKPPLKQRVQVWVREHPAAFVLILVATLVLIVAAVFFWMYLQSYVNTDDAEIEGHINQIGSRVAGTVTGVYTENTHTVQRGQVLVDLDPTDYRTALAQAQANLAQAESALDAQSPNVPITQTTEATNVATANLEVANAEAALEATRQSHVSALADLQQAEANAQNAATEEQRYRRLADKQEVSRELYDQRATEAKALQALVAARRATADAAAKSVAQREAALDQVRARAYEATTNQPRQVASQRANVATRRANVEAAKAQVEQARLNLSYCKIVAPVTGIVGDKTVEVGQQITPGQELFAITPLDDIWVTANFKETQTIHMRAGLSVTIHVDALAQDFKGWVQNLPGATGAMYSLLPPENATGNYVKVVQRLPVRIRFRDGQPGLDRLRPGMSVEPKVWLK